MDPDDLLLARLADLQRRLRPTRDEYFGLYEDYDLLGLAAILRQLIMDQVSLMDVVNRRHRLKVVFRVNDSIPTSRVWWAVMDELDPDIGQNTLGHWYVAFSAIAYKATNSHQPRAIEVRKSELLRRPVIVVDGHEYNVGNLILHIANVEGGVHYGEVPEGNRGSGEATDSERLRVLRQFVRESTVATYRDISTGEELITPTIRIPGSEGEPVTDRRPLGEKVGEVSSALRILLAVGRVVYAGLGPLRQAIEAERVGDDASSTT